METSMPQSHTAEQDPATSFVAQDEARREDQPKKAPPKTLYDSKHGTKVKQWTNTGKFGDFTEVVVERSTPDGQGRLERKRSSY
jgi:hypothetical protein